MGYNASSVETDFTVPADKVPDALAALNAAIAGDTYGGVHAAAEPGGYTSLAAAVDEYGGFEGSEDPGDNVNREGFSIGWYPSDKYGDEWVALVLTALAPYAAEGSFVRFMGEDDSLFGFRVVAGKLVEETGDFTWRCPQTDTPTTNAARRARGAALVNDYIENISGDTGYDDVSDAVCDLLADLRHYCATVSGLEFDAVDARAAMHYQAEASS